MLENFNIRETWLADSTYHVIKRETVMSILDYAEHGIPVGGFLTSVLCNDLSGAVSRADPENLAALKAITLFCHMEIPGNIWGSVDKMQAHILRHDLARHEGGISNE